MEKDCGMWINILSHMLKKRMNANTQSLGITGVQSHDMHYILVKCADGPVFQRDVERAFSLSRSTATGILQLMEKNGFLLREPVAYDARLKKLVLTPRYYLTVFLRLILYPMVTLGLLWLLKAQTWIPDGKAILMTVFLSGITPVCSALNSMVQLYDRDMEESGALYVLTTLLSIVTMPLVIAVFERVM